jgi:flagellar protein FlaJ
MTALSLAAVSRESIFRLTAQQPLKTAATFRKVYALTKELGLTYAQSLRMVSIKVRATALKDLLLRFAGSLESGEAEQDFLEAETRIAMQQYIEGYERGLESLKKWTDAYAAILVSVTLIVVVAMLSTLIGPLNHALIVVIGFCLSWGVTVALYPILKAIPGEIKTYTSREAMPFARRMASRLAILFIPLGMMLGSAVGYRFGAGYGMLVFGAHLLPAGIFALRDHINVTRVDEAIPSTVRNLGATIAALGVTPSRGLTKITKESMGALASYIHRLSTRLSYQLNPGLCWEMFFAETGSELIRRTMRPFVEAINHGADPEKVGELCSNYALGISLVRAKRNALSKTFAYLIFPLHGVMTALMVFILEVTLRFNAGISAAMSSFETSSPSPGSTAIPTLPFFVVQDMTPLSVLTISAILILSIINSLAIRAAIGGHPLTATLYAGIMFLLSGLSLIIVPLLAGSAISI